MEKKNKGYDNYPIWIVFLTNFLTLLLYLSGGYIIFKLSWITGVLYLLFIGILEIQIYREGCINCFYYGKMCAFGRGAIAPIFFKKGDGKKFCERNLGFKDFIPQILAVAIPVLVGIALLISRGFNLLIVVALIYPILSWVALNPVIYGKLACPNCKQGKMCCPALEFFSKKKK